MASPDNNNLQSLSVSSALNNIVAFFNSQDNNSSWKSLTSSSEGSFLIRLLATITSNISYKVVSYVREVFLSTCNLISSAIGISVNLGYSVYRGSNQKRLITVLPTTTVVIPKYSVIGTYNSDYDIINIDDLHLHENELADIHTVIGKLKTIKQTAGTTELKIFSFYTPNISEDLILFKDGVEMPYSKNPKDMANDSYWIRTNPFSSIDIQYLNNVTGANYTYSAGSIFTVSYIELADVPTVPYTNNMFPYFNLVNTRVIKQYIPMESVNNIKTTASYYHETQNIIRAKKDFHKRLPEIDTSVITSDYTVVVPTYAAVSYIKNDYSLLKEDELLVINNTFSNERFLGTPLPDITHPSRELITLNIGLKFTSRLINLANVDTDIQNILNANYYGILNNAFTNYDLEELLVKSLSYVSNARVSVVVNDRINTGFYNTGDIIYLNGIYYKATGILGKSGSNQPNWNLPSIAIENIDTGLETIDNNIIWKAYKRLNLDNTQIRKWAPNTPYKIGDYIYVEQYPYYMFKVVDLIKYNDPALSAPPSAFSVGGVGAFIEDGNILWVGKLLNTSNPVRTGNTSYRLGDCVQVGSYSYECIGYRGESDILLPTFELYEYSIVSKGSNYFDINGDYTKYFNKDDIMKVLISNSLYYSFSVADVNYINSLGITRIDVNQTVDLQYNYNTIVKRNIGTDDGNVFWEIVNDVSSYTSSWKVFNTIKYSIRTL